MIAIDKCQVDRLLRTMRRGLNPHKLKPVVFSGDSITVHGAVKVDCGKPVPMCVQDVVDIGLFDHVCRTFIMQDNVKALRPIGMIINRESSLG